MPVLLLLFIAIPLIEIYVLVSVGKVVGALPTVVMVVATAVVGLALLRRQGRRAWLSAQSKLASGALPSTELVDGLFLAVGGALLLTPGFVTDAVGFACLIPGVRRFLVAKGFVRALLGGQVRFYSQQSPPSDARRPRTFEGEYEREDDDRPNLP